MKFEDFPIEFEETEYGKDGWSRSVVRQGTIADLLEIWDIDDPEEGKCAIAQVLRHLRSILSDS
jgi:hypothetical protein